MKLEQSNSLAHIWFIGFLCLFVSTFVLIPLLQKETLQTNWKAIFAEEGEVFRTGQAIELHFFLEDEGARALEDATVTAVFDRVETVHQIEKEFFNVENGLYETEVVFSVPGTWIVMLDVKKGQSYYRNQFLIQVDGPIISTEHRDPADHFHLNQPLPNELQRELQ